MERIIFTPISSAIATLSSDEANLGSIVVDMGAGTTSYSIFSDNIFRYAGVVSHGGNNITIDIARALSISMGDAEKLKILYVGVLTNSYDSGDTVAIRQAMRKMQTARNKFINQLVQIYPEQGSGDT